MPTVSHKLNDRFWSDTVRTAVPIAIWGGHFFFVYWAIAFACQRGPQYAAAGMSWITIVLWVLTAAAIGVLIVMIVLDGRRIRQRREREGVQRFVQIGVAVFALVGVIWSSVPVVAAAPCANPYELSRSVE